MQLRILGCSGGIGGDLRTTSMLLDHDTLIDAGTGVGDLSINQLAQIDHIFVTHSHMDHVATIPFIVDTVGYHLDSGKASLVFTGDTTTNDALWPIVNQIANLKYLIIETALSDRERELARLSKHLCPSLLAAELAKLKLAPEIYITHLKPRESELIMQQIAVTVSGDGEGTQAAHAAKQPRVRVLKRTRAPGMRGSNDKSPGTAVQQGTIR